MLALFGARSCKRCSKVLPADAKHNRLYCTERCAQAAQRARKRQRRWKPYERKCKECKEMFTIATPRQHRRLYCSSRCAHRRHAREYFRRTYALIKPGQGYKHPRVCARPGCGKGFRITNGNRLHQKFCSPTCRSYVANRRSRGTLAA